MSHQPNEMKIVLLALRDASTAGRSEIVIMAWSYRAREGPSLYRFNPLTLQRFNDHNECLRQSPRNRLRDRACIVAGSAGRRIYGFFSSSCVLQLSCFFAAWQRAAGTWARKALAANGAT